MPFISHTPASAEECCTHPEHDPPSHIVLAPGTHVYECPNCKAKKTIVVRGPRYKAPSTSPYRPTDSDYFRRLQEEANRRSKEDYEQHWRRFGRRPDSDTVWMSASNTMVQCPVGRSTTGVRVSFRREQRQIA